MSDDPLIEAWDGEKTNGYGWMTRCKAAEQERDEARKIAEDMFGVLDELGCGMKPLPWEEKQDA